MKTKAIAITGAAAAAHVVGLSKEQAAHFLGCSVRQIERRARAGQIRKTVLPRSAGEKTAPVLYDRRDLEALKRGETLAKSVRVVADPIVVNRAGAADSLLRHLSAALALPPAKPWLSISEATTFSGLPAAFLRDRAPELARIGAAVNVGRGTRPRWRLLRAQLERGFPAGT